MNFCILDANGMPKRVEDAATWARWFANADRVVFHEKIGNARVSTVFIGLPASFHEGDVIEWETMAFGPDLEIDQMRCTGSREQAEAMHARMVALVRAAAIES